MVETSGATIRTLRGGNGPPLLLLHGHPQTHVCWHKIAAPLAEHFTVVLTDLRGYGDSSKPAGGERSVNYSPRAMARDQLEVMRHFGFERFGVAGHDRGGRVAHRMALDFPAAISRIAVLDIAPTLTMYRQTNQEFATRYVWWFFQIQAYPIPEHLIGMDPERLATPRWPNISAATAQRRRSTRCAKTTGPPPASASNSTRATSATGAKSSHRCSRSGAQRASSVSSTMYWKRGARGRPTCAAWRSIADTCFPKSNPPGRSKS
jgi:pimeloyl-ACP methyl ester carboxylesterase